MSKINKSIKELTSYAPLVGQLNWIGIRSERRGDISTPQSIKISVEDGLLGDHYQGRNKKRQITLIQSEHLKSVASMLKIPKIDPKLTRRNLVVEGINLLAFKELQFKIGAEVILEMTGLCHPCSRMEENLGDGGYHAMRGHGGITAKVVRGGTINLGDSVVIIDKDKTS